MHLKRIYTNKIINRKKDLITNKIAKRKEVLLLIE